MQGSYLGPILGSHVRRLGWTRVLVGGLSMYVTIPIIVFFHLTIVVLLYQWTLRPLFGLERVHWANHVRLDRHRIAGLSPIDKFNCEFCGYANGLCTMLNKELDHLSRHSAPIGWWRATVAVGVLLPILPALAVAQFLADAVYGVLISRPLRMARTSAREVDAVLASEGYAASFAKSGQGLLLYVKNFAVRFSMALQQIESAWCPLRYHETREGFVTPQHHALFFGPDEIEAMRRRLSSVGTVLPLEPAEMARACQQVGVPQATSD